MDNILELNGSGYWVRDKKYQSQVKNSQHELSNSSLIGTIVVQLVVVFAVTYQSLVVEAQQAKSQKLNPAGRKEEEYVEGIMYQYR
jgi:hypothetical protein